MACSRREFLDRSLHAGLAWPAARWLGAGPLPSFGREMFPDFARGVHGDSALASALRNGARLPDGPVPPGEGLPLASRFEDLKRHFVFEYYPWYATDPWRHWDQWDREPPLDLAANYMPRLGAYDSLSPAVLERHARWIAGAGVGAVNLSWWGRGSHEDRAVPLIMDVMKAHGIKVAFHLEPYSLDHGERFAEDVFYLLREYGEKRRYDALLLLRNADAAAGPVFKGFRTILPEIVTDCHGRSRRVPDYTPDDVYRHQTHMLRDSLRGDFDHITLLADSLDFGRTRAAGFDGIAIYDNSVAPESYGSFGAAASAFDLLFSFNVNPGSDTIAMRRVDPGACYAPSPFEPGTTPLDWRSGADRETAARLGAERIRESLAATLRVQGHPALSNVRRGFFLVYVTSFNEWHEGHAFEPMLDAGDLPPAEALFGYHNPASGSYRLDTLASELQRLVSPALESLDARA